MNTMRIRFQNRLDLYGLKSMKMPEHRTPEYLNTGVRYSQKCAPRAAVALALALALLFGLRAESRGDATNYASDRRQVRACILVSTAAVTGGVNENRVPYIFYIMDRRIDLKPNGWEFINPLAPSAITSDIYLRWKARGGAVDPAFQNGTPQSTLFQIGAPLSKNMGAYWEVDLDAVTPDDLQQFDVAVIATRTAMTFSASERDKIRRFADSGGTIWLEDEGGADINAGGPFITDVGFDVALPAGTPQLNTAHHPLVNFPFAIGAYDVQSLGLGAAGLTHHSHRDQVQNQLVNPHFVAPIVIQGGVPLISAGDFGAGHLVISSAGIATGINSFAGGTNVIGGNSGAISGEVLLGVLPSDIKFAYNLVAWTSSIPTHGVNTRRSGGTRENIGSDLGRKWQTAPKSADPAGDGSGAVIHKGVVFWVDGENILHAYDASPEQDLDGDQNSDDGIPDLIFGTPFDEIWNVDLKTFNIGATTRVSTPTIVSVNNSLTTSNPVDIVTVTGSNGVTLAFNAFPQNAAGRLLTTSPLLWQVSDATNIDGAGQMVDGHGFKLPGASPAFSEGVLFTVVNDPNNSANNPWRVVAIDPINGHSVFDGSTINGGVTTTSGVAPTDQFNNVIGLSTVTGPINVGYIRDLATGALDKMVYVQTTPFNNGTTALGGGQVVGCWFGTKQEPMQSIDGTPGNVDHTRFRASGERDRIPWYLPNGPVNGLDLRPAIYVNFANGVKKRLVYQTDFTVTYEGTVPSRDLIVTLNIAVTDSDKVFADYTVDWPDTVINSTGGQPNTPQAQEMQRFVSRKFTLPAPVPNQAFVIAGTALTPEDNMVINSSDFPGFDKIYAVRDQYPSFVLGPAARSGKVSWAWGPNGPSDTTNPLDPDSLVGINGTVPRLINIDPWVPETKGPVKPKGLVVTDLELVGSPAVSNGVVYEVGFAHMKDGSGLGGVEFDAAVIMALRSNPNNTFTIVQNGSPIQFDTTTTAGQPLVTLEQLDLVNSQPGNPRFIQLFENVNFTVDRISSSVTLTDFRSANNGDTFNAAMPIFVRIGATRLTDPIVNANTGYGPLDNLLWWTVIPTVTPAAAATIGLQADATQVAVDIQPHCGVTAVGDTLYFGTTGGSIASFDLTGIQNNGGQTKIYRADGTLRIHRQPAIIDPTDITGVNPIANNAIISPPLATTGIVVAGTRRGLVALDNQLTLIADNNRLLEVDSAGRAVHSIDATQTDTIAGGATIVAPDSGQIVNTRIPLDRPSIARRTGLSDYLVCDTGNNRVVQMSQGGLVTWELHSVNNDMHFLRPGDPVTLSAPSDVQTYTDSSLNGALSFTNPNTGVTYTRPAGYYFATHYIIADSGNFRGLEVVDIVDQTNTPLTLTGSDGTAIKMLRQVLFVTRSLGEQNRNIRYRTMQQFTFFNAKDMENQTLMVAAVDNLRLGALDPGTLPVGVTSVDTQGPGAGIALIHRFPTAKEAANGVKDGDVATVINSIAFLDANGAVAVDTKGNVLRHAIANPTYFREIEDATFNNATGVATATTKYLLADSNGVYQLRPSTAADKTQLGGSINGSEALVEWMLTAQDYLFMTGRPLRAMSVQKLQTADPFVVNGAVAGYKPHYLIANGFSGLDTVGQTFGDPRVLPGELHGEVFEVRGLDYYLPPASNNFFNGYQHPSARLYVPVSVGTPPATVIVLGKNLASSIVFIVPNETLPGVDANNNPLTKAIKRSIGLTDGGTATYLLEQPTSASRPF